MYYYEDTKRWKVMDLDVWFDGIDYDINDFHEICEVTFTDEEIRYDYKIIEKLIDLEILKPEARDLAYVDSDYGWMYIRDKDTDEPLYGLELIRVFHKTDSGVSR